MVWIVYANQLTISVGLFFGLYQRVSLDAFRQNCCLFLAVKFGYYLLSRAVKCNYNYMPDLFRQNITTFAVKICIDLCCNQLFLKLKLDAFTQNDF